MGISNKVIIGTFSKCVASVDVIIEERHTVVPILRGGVGWEHGGYARCVVAVLVCNPAY